MLAYYSIYKTFPKQTPQFIQLQEDCEESHPFTTQQCIIFFH